MCRGLWYFIISRKGTAMKRLLFVLLISSYTTIASLGYIYAGSLSDADAALSVEEFEITSGIDKEKDSEATFDETRIISGTAEPDTNIIISVYEPVVKDEEKELIEINSYELTVGSSGRFMQTVKLALGENYIVITAQNDEKVSKEAFTVKRKKMQIKNELEQNIALPGQKTEYVVPKN